MLNHWVGMGRLTADPILRTTQSGVPVVSFTIAVDRDYKQGGNKQTDFIGCVAWRGTAEFVSKYWRRGQFIVLSGRLHSRQWEDRDGKKRTEWEIQVDNVYFGEAKRDQQQESTGGQQFQEIEDEEDLPF